MGGAVGVRNSTGIRPAARPGEENTTDRRMLSRAPAFVGVLLLLFTIASGLALGQSTEQIGATALRTHSVAGVVGAVLCFVGIAIVIHQSDRVE